MRLLLDTQVFLWFLADDRRLSKVFRSAIGALDNAVLVSAASIWEIAIKSTLGRVDLAARDAARLAALIDASGFDELPITARHAAAVRDLPSHHRDPFDRLLVAQARLETLTLVTVDRALRQSGVPLL